MSRSRSPGGSGALGFLFLFGLAGMLAEDLALWQTRVAVEAQGRVFALRRLITFAALPVSYALAGLLADYVFEPLVRSAASHASPLSALWGAGRGRGTVLLLVCGGDSGFPTRLRSLFLPAQQGTAANEQREPG